MNDSKIDPQPFDYDAPDDPSAFEFIRSPGYKQRTFDEHNANVIAALRELWARCKRYATSRRF